MMSARAIVVSVCVGMLGAVSVQAQFIGDALAAAGVAAGEQQAAAAVGSVRGVSAPKAGSAHEASGPQSARVYESSEVGKDVGIQRPASSPDKQGQPAGATSASSGSSSATSSTMKQPQVGGSSGFAGARLQAGNVDPAELAAWQGAMNPVGASVTSLPDTAVAISLRGKTYQYDKGVFYEKKGARYEAVPAPAGAAVKSKPPGAATVFSEGKPYVYYFGAFYVYDGVQRAYVVVAPPAGALVDYLPDSAKKVEWQGAAHYLYAGTYYKPHYRGSNLVFEVAAQS